MEMEACTVLELSCICICVEIAFGCDPSFLVRSYTDLEKGLNRTKRGKIVTDQH